MLPSSIVRYTTEAITGSGELGKEASFNVKLLKHAIHFASSVRICDDVIIAMTSRIA